MAKMSDSQWIQGDSFMVFGHEVNLRAEYDEFLRQGEVTLSIGSGNSTLQIASKTYYEKNRNAETIRGLVAELCREFAEPFLNAGRRNS